MSKELLLSLNQDHDGLLGQWLDENPWEPRIAWYPNSGMDFRDLLYLSQSWENKNKLGLPHPPSIFIHNDCRVTIGGSVDRGYGILSDRLLYRDFWTTIRVIDVESLPRLNLSQKGFSQNHNRIQTTRSKDDGMVLFMMISIDSERLGVLLQPLIYIIGETSAIADELFLRNNSRISHVWHTFPGTTNCHWIGHTLQRLNVDFIAKDGNFYEPISSADEQNNETLDSYPRIRGCDSDLPQKSDWISGGQLCNYWHAIHFWTKNQITLTAEKQLQGLRNLTLEKNFSKFAQVEILDQHWLRVVFKPEYSQKINQDARKKLSYAIYWRINQEFAAQYSASESLQDRINISIAESTRASYERHRISRYCGDYEIFLSWRFGSDYEKNGVQMLLGFPEQLFRKRTKERTEWWIYEILKATIESLTETLNPHE
jgi:hypothetical protein